MAWAEASPGWVSGLASERGSVRARPARPEPLPARAKRYAWRSPTAAGVDGAPVSIRVECRDAIRSSLEPKGSQAGSE